MPEQSALSGKVALVTGSSRGLGRHYALHLARAGADVIVHDVSEEAAAAFGEAPTGPAVAEEIRALGRKSAFFAADLADPAQTEALVDRALQAFGRIDILVNNAGGDIGAQTPRPEPNDGLDISPEDIRSVVDRNLLTTLHACKYVGRHMRERSGFDEDFFEFQQDFLFSTIAHFVTALETPITGGLVNPEPQRNDVPDELVLRAEASDSEDTASAPEENPA